MFQKIIAFFMSVISFFLSLFGLGGDLLPKTENTLTNVSYGTHARQVVDIAFPENTVGEVGLILMIHGGAWISGDKSAYSKQMKYGAQHGYVTAAMNYRYISDSVNAFNIMDDITAALNVIKDKAASRGITVKKVLLTGASAGAHLSLLYAYTKKDVAPVTPAAVASYCGPTDLADTEIIRAFLFNGVLGSTEYVTDLFSKLCGYKFTEANYDSQQARDALKAVSPLYFVSADTVPTVISHGLLDTVVPYANAMALDMALTANGVKHDFVTFPKSTHLLENDPDCTTQADALLMQYAAEYLK